MASKSRNKGVFTVAGIDPGLKGGLAVVNPGGTTALRKMPVTNDNKLDIPALALWIRTMDMIIVEKQQSFPAMGKVPSFSLGYQYGVICGLIEAYGKFSHMVRPLEWKSAILYDFKDDDGKYDKESSIRYVNHRFPKLDLLPTARSTKKSDGLADALCLAIYGIEILMLGGGTV